jgi:transcriptional regulator with XRE-family HTH domain
MGKKEIGQRLKLFRKKNEIDQEELAKNLNKSQSSISQAENGKKALKQETLELLGVKYPINLGWLLTGKGKMEIDQQPAALREHTPSYLTPKRQEILEFLQENPAAEDLIFTYIRGKKTSKEALARLQEDFDPAET